MTAAEKTTAAQAQGKPRIGRWICKTHSGLTVLAEGPNRVQALEQAMQLYGLIVVMRPARKGPQA